ncbi:MAG: DNA-deoxyinosine glycosylase [Rhodobacteraceae bacterium]|nr:DNA-deoxyinosine glycosylase [Paracoccaceae bacterium]MCY4195342.1 DNA-deoxyinosine glycosylase [Paracoccaceae bacterium]
MKTGLTPIANDNSRILILGSLPGDISLAAQEYYANSSNQFWRILSRTFEETTGEGDESRRSFLLRSEIALWDIFAAAERTGSLDSQIRSPIYNDLASLIDKYPCIDAIGLNGKRAYQGFKLYCAQNPDVAWDGMRVCCLPSTSAANAKMTFDEKLRVWRAFLKPAS